ncbi:unnamed protein product [Polarella glacialis]|uniref:Uncharacterized protein n=1 Tax=Polarella glacialis TaxID=89957 RepID=A0A813GEV6_POLGL|nr:unnamed protein product [Polarella glacialis]CAE8646548.1 unnamed protein product [Polarella glacialis]|eukprot:CAMPEP_0115079954 /NCGR_PEP_ID=MMETSP0227-20121206/18400_1 /TAXON_ID=89957 /ORGANISM="Polarella glacialis, Strain CCMP 1383" /LENGTH=230 /DNA_ID=CAMNT_0002467525 /DNA_START=170 /DNA_END=862 /DNA_ORIENTATION=-
MELELIPGSEASAPEASKSAKDAAIENRIGMPQKLTGPPRGKLRFRASAVYKEVLADHLLPAGLEIQMDVATGKNLARLCHGQSADYALSKDNYAMVGDALRAAATHGQADLVKALVATCFYDSATMLPALLEASSKGYLEVVEALLKGDMSKADPVAVDEKEGKSALHRAMVNGHEDICMRMIDALPSAAAARPLNKQGLDPFAATREEDLGPVAKRMEKYLAEKFPVE